MESLALQRRTYDPYTRGQRTVGKSINTPGLSATPCAFDVGRRVISDCGYADADADVRWLPVIGVPLRRPSPYHLSRRRVVFHDVKRRACRRERRASFKINDRGYGDEKRSATIWTDVVLDRLVGVRDGDIAKGMIAGERLRDEQHLDDFRQRRVASFLFYNKKKKRSKRGKDELQDSSCCR